MEGEKKPNTRILVVAMSPPPYGGQALMVETMLNSDLEGVEFHHVRMSFSASMKSIGRFEWKKVFHMFGVVSRSLAAIMKHKPQLLYYVPGGSGKAPVIRDIFILSLIRPFSPKVVYHFHAAGVCEVVQELPALLKKMALKVYSRPDMGIFLSGRNPDNDFFKPVQSRIIPNGLSDEARPYLPFSRGANKSVRILFVGVIQESKGVTILLKAIKQLRKRKVKVELVIMGEYSSEGYREKAEAYMQKHMLGSVVRFTGVLTGKEKWNQFALADIFCFPSFFESESFGNVLVEAMMFELPVVATNWRGIPDIVEDGVTGFLVPVKEVEPLAASLETLAKSEELRTKMGKKGRIKYLSKYQLNRFVDSIQSAFDQTMTR